MTTSIRVPTLPGHDFNLPAGLEGLDELAYNLWWSWTPRAQALFSRIKPAALDATPHAIGVLRDTDHARWAELTADEDFMVDASRVLDEFSRYMANGAGSWYRRVARAALPGPIAYFCAEFGIHESMQIYSGGLGVLAGDHCKSASDAALPFIGIGLLYRRGYFRQQIDADGHQEHAQPDLDPAQLPMRRARGRDGSPLEVSVEIADRLVHAAVWVAEVGRVPILLLDTDIPRQRSRRSTDHAHPLRARPRDAALPGARARDRRRARPPRPGHRARPSGTSTRGTPRSSSWSGRASSSPPSPVSPPERRCGESAATRCSPSTPPFPPATRSFGRELVDRRPPPLVHGGRARSRASCSSSAAVTRTTPMRRST